MSKIPLAGHAFLLPLPTAYCLLAFALLAAGCRPQTPGDAAPAGGALAGRAEVAEGEDRTVALDGRTLVLDGFAGDVLIEADPEATGVRVRFERRARGATEASARERLAAVRIDEAGDGEIYQYVWRADGPADGLSVNAVAVVPPGTPVVVRLEAGGVAADGLVGDFDAEVGAGTVVMGRAASGRLRVAVGAGDVGVNAAAVPAGARWTLETGAGDLDLALPDAASVVLDASTDAGRIVDRGLDLGGAVRSGGPAGSRIQATLGRGAATATLRTGAGTVTLGGPTDIDGTESGRAPDPVGAD